MQHSVVLAPWWMHRASKREHERLRIHNHSIAVRLLTSLHVIIRLISVLSCTVLVQFQYFHVVPLLTVMYIIFFFQLNIRWDFKPRRVVEHWTSGSQPFKLVSGWGPSSCFSCLCVVGRFTQETFALYSWLTASLNVNVSRPKEVKKNLEIFNNRANQSKLKRKKRKQMQNLVLSSFLPLYRLTNPQVCVVTHWKGPGLLVGKH